VISFNEEERLTPTIIRRRIATVKRALGQNKESTESLHLQHKKDLGISDLSGLNLATSERMDSSLERQLVRLSETEMIIKRKQNQEIISDHAVLRYIERVLKISTSQIRDRLKGKDINRIKEMKSGSIDRDEYSLVVANGIVTTILGDGMIDLNPIEREVE
jgi:hypothetical protein